MHNVSELLFLVTVFFESRQLHLYVLVEVERCTVIQLLCIAPFGGFILCHVVILAALNSEPS